MYTKGGRIAYNWNGVYDFVNSYELYRKLINGVIAILILLDIIQLKKPETCSCTHTFKNIKIGKRIGLVVVTVS